MVWSLRWKQGSREAEVILPSLGPLELSPWFLSRVITKYVSRVLVAAEGLRRLYLYHSGCLHPPGGNIRNPRSDWLGSPVPRQIRPYVISHSHVSSRDALHLLVVLGHAAQLLISPQSISHNGWGSVNLGSPPSQE